MTTKNQLYPNSTIVEAICELHVQLDPDLAWSANKPAELMEVLKESYSEFELVSNSSIEIEITQEGPQTKVTPNQPIARFKDSIEERILQLNQSTVVFNFVSNYPGWLEVSKVINETLEKIRPIIGLNSVTRIGLRYINSIKFNENNEQLSTWLQPTEYLPSSLISSKRGFRLKQEVMLSEGERLILSIAEARPMEGSEFGALVFDLDRVSQSDTLNDSKQITAKLEELHGKVREVFDQAITERYKELMSESGGLKK